MADLKDVEQLNAAYCRIFESPDGKIVFDDLMRNYYDGPMTGERCDINRELGRRDVVLAIKNKLEYQQNQRKGK